MTDPDPSKEVYDQCLVATGQKAVKMPQRTLEFKTDVT
jgi:hypothetical protein